MFPKFPMDSQQAPNNTLLYPIYIICFMFYYYNVLLSKYT